MQECELWLEKGAWGGGQNKKKHENAKKKKNARFRFSLCGHVTSAFPSLPDKNFEDDDSVDGGRSSSSSKGASQCGRKPVSMGSFRRPSSASSAKSAGENWKRKHYFSTSALCDVKKGPHTSYELVTTPPTPSASETTTIWFPFPITCPVNHRFRQESCKQEVLFFKNVHVALLTLVSRA